MTTTQSSVLPLLPLAKALRDQHRTFLGEGFPVGLTFAPKVTEGSTSRVADAPYVVLIPIGARTHGPPFVAPDADVSAEFQVTMVSKTGTQLLWMQDKVIELWLGRTPEGRFLHELEVPDGYRVMDRRPSENLGSEPLGGDTGAVTASATLRFVLDVTPSAVVVP